MMVYVYSIMSVLIISLISLVGVFTLSLKAQVLHKYLFLFISLAVGALIGDAFIHLIPEAFEKSADPLSVSLAIIGGMLIFFILEKILHWHHHQTDEEELTEVPTIHHSGRMVLFSDGIHNFIDGLIIGVSYLVSVEVGIATTLAVLLHEIPQEIGDFGVLIHSGYTTTRALFLNFLSALTALLGTLFALALSDLTSTLTYWLIPLAAGGFIYVAMADLIPEMHKTKSMPQSILQILFALVGIGAMLLLLFVE